MSVIVKGRNMPRHCGECACSNYYDRIDALLCDFTEKQLDEKTWKKERHPDCPLVEVPTPHGRLIDANFEEMHYTSMTTNPTPDVTEQDKRNSLIIIKALQMAKTIIEEE